MKFQKINFMLLTTLLWNSVGFSEGGERVARRSLSPVDTDETEMTKFKTKAEEKEELKKIAEEKDQKEKDYKTLKLDPKKHYSTDNVNAAHQERSTVNQNMYNDPKIKFNLDTARDRIINDPERKAEEARREEIAQNRTKQKEKSGYTLSDFEDDTIRTTTSGSLLTKINSMSATDLSNPKTLDSKTIKYLTPDAIANIAQNPEKLRALLSNPNVPDNLTKEQVQAIPAEALTKAILDNVTTRLSMKSRRLTDQFVDKLSPEQAKALVDGHDSSIFKTIRHYFTDSQMEHLRDLARTGNDSNEEARARATTLAKRLGSQNGSLNTDEEVQQLKVSISKLDTKQKEYVVNSFVRAQEEKLGLTDEKGKWLFKDSSKINSLEIKLKAATDKFIQTYLNDSLSSNEFAITTKNKGVSGDLSVKIINFADPIDNLFTDKENVSTDIPKELITKLNTQAQADITQINSANIPYVSIKDLSVDQIKSLSVDQIKALSVDQKEALSAGQIASLSQAQTTALDDEATVNAGDKDIDQTTTSQPDQSSDGWNQDEETTVDDPNFISEKEENAVKDLITNSKKIDPNAPSLKSQLDKLNDRQLTYLGEQIGESNNADLLKKIERIYPEGSEKLTLVKTTAIKSKVSKFTTEWKELPGMGEYRKKLNKQLRSFTNDEISKLAEDIPNTTNKQKKLIKYIQDFLGDKDKIQQDLFTSNLSQASK